MIAAFHGVAFAPPFGQRHLAVGAGVFQRHDLARTVAKHADPFLKQDDLLQVFGDFVTPGGNIPGISEKHAAQSFSKHDA